MAFVQNVPLFGILLPILCGVLCLPLPALWARRLTLGALGVTGALSVWLLAFVCRTGESYVYMMGHFPAPFGNELRIGPLEALMAAVFAAVMLLSVLCGMRDIFDDIPPKKISFYFVMINMLHAAMQAIIYTNDLFTAFIFIDLITIAACSVVMSKPGGRTLIATMSYLIMSLIGSSLILLSIALLYGVTGHLLMPQLGESVAVLMATGQYRMPLFVMLALMTVGLGIKSALFPFHVWLPDAHASASTPSSSILSGLVIKCYLILLIKLYLRVFGLEAVRALHVTDVLLLFGLLGLVVGSATALRQRNIKRMLSYASVSQIGYICMAIGLCSMAGMVAALFHILAHACAKALMFAAAGAMGDVSGHRKDFGSLRGAGRRDPVAGVAFSVGALSMIGLPLFSGFVSKLYLATAAMDGLFSTIVVLLAIAVSTVLGAMYYLPAIGCVMSRPEDLDSKPVARPIGYKLAMGAFIALNLLLGLWSGPFLRTIERGLQVFG